MNVSEMHNQIRALGAQIATASANLAQAAANATTSNAELDRMTGELSALQNRMAAMQAAVAAQTPGEPAPNAQTPADRTLSDMLKSREYARAFALAIRTGANANRPMQDERLKPLYDAMTIGGGDPAGEDGGFLVPEDIDHMVREKVRELSPLADLFNEESVSTNSGWRVTDTAPTTGFSSIDEAATVPTDDQPVFSKVTFSLTKYGLRVPVSRELANDEVGNLFGYLANWFAKKMVITQNGLLLTALSGLSPTVIAEGGELTGIKTALNVALDPAISRNAAILTNQTGFNLLDNMVDGTGRPLLQYFPQDGTPRMMNGKAVKVVSDTTLPNTDTNTYAPIYIGDFKQYATLFSRMPLEVASTDIGGTAWTNATIEVRGLTRMCVSKFDTAAAVYRKLTL